MKTNIRLSSALAAAFAGVASVAGAATIYVAPSGDGSSGQAWATAYRRLDTALARAGVGDAIWVKQGTYSVSATLQWKNAVDVYGGFAGAETDLNQRSKDASLTILDGGGAVRVLNTEYDLTIETTWSGFTIRNGKYTPSGEGDGGAGVKMRNNTILDNCIVENNELGGAVKNTGGAGIVICPSINPPEDPESPGVIIVKNCKIRGNKSNNQGGGIFIGVTQSDHYKASVYIQNSEIINNYANVQAGAIATIMGNASAKYYIISCVIANNYAETNNGGAVFINHLGNNDMGGSISFYNCTVVNNRSGSKQYGSVGGIYANNNTAVDVKNCVFWGNKIPDFDDVSNPVVHFKGNHDNVKLLTCAFDGQEHGTNVVDANNEQPVAVSNGNTTVKFKNPTSFAGNATSEDELAEAYNPDAWVVEEGSLLIDAGTVIPDVTSDIAGNTRYTDGTNRFDIGAYEYVVAGTPTDPNEPTDAGKVGNAGAPQIFSAAGSIIVRNNENPAAVAYVYDLNGSLVKVAPLAPGNNTIAVAQPQKIYIVKAGQTVQKVLVVN